MYLCCAGPVYKLWLLRNVLKCQMLVFCGLDVKQTLKTRGKLRRGRGKKKIIVFGSPNVVFGTGINPSWWLNLFGVKEKSALVWRASGGEAVRGAVVTHPCWNGVCAGASSECTERRSLCGFVSNSETTSRILMAL